METSECEKLEAQEVMESDLYSQPREKRKSVTMKKATLLRRSKRFTLEQNVQLNEVEIFEEKEEASAAEHPSFALGLKWKIRSIGTSNSQTK